MEPAVTTDSHEHVINIPRNNVASISSHYDDGNDDSDELRYAVAPSTSTQQPPSNSSSSTSPSVSNSRSGSFTRRGDNHGRPRQRNPLNSGLWISIELVVNVSQIIAAAIVLSLSRHEHPQSPLFAWVIGYTVGCIATLPHLYWRYIHRNNQSSEHPPEHSQQAPSQLNLPDSISYTNVIYPQTLGGEGRSSSTAVMQSRWNSMFFGTRFNTLVDHFKMALDCFFAVWFVVGTVWIFGGHSSAYTAPNLYRLCIVFLTFSCIGYAMPFVLCATICCCLPCIISLLGSREDLRPARGATTDVINALTTYKFKSRRNQNRGDNINSSEHLGEGGIVAAGTKKERIISAEDAVCCICLATYLDNDALRELPCSHFFHTECVDKWLKVNAICPLCKVGLGDTSPSFFSYFGRLLNIRRLGSTTDASRVVL